VLLFELAISLDMRSSDLVDLARDAGLGSLQAGSDLDASQVAALRARAGGPIPPAPSAAPTPAGDLPPLGPATWGAPAPVDPGGPKAPAHWGPPPGVGSAPAPAPAAPAAPLAAAPPSAAPLPPAAAPGPVTTGSGPALWGAPTEPDVPASEEPVVPVPPSSSSGFSKGQLAAVGLAVVLAVGLFAFMAANTGGDEPPGEAAAAEQATTAVPAGPRDEAAYCRGVEQVSPFVVELGRYAAGTAPEQFARFKALAAQQQASVDSGMDLIVANGPASSADDAAVLADGLDQVMGAAQASSSDAEFAAALRDAGPTSFSRELDRLVTEWSSVCS